MMDNETWIVGSQANEYGLKCNIVETGESHKIAAKIRNHKFSKMPREIMDKIINDENDAKKKIDEKNDDGELKTDEDTKEETTVILENEDEKTDEEKTEDTDGKLKTEDNEQTEEKAVEKNDEEMITMKEANKRVSGMQSKMSLQINEFRNQIRVRDEELTSVKNEVISLKSKLEETRMELSRATSALQEKTNALAILNTSVNAPVMSTNKVDWRKLHGQEFFNWLESSKK